MSVRTAEEERWRLAVETAAFGVWDLDPRAELVHYSPQWKASLGFDSADRPDSTSFWRSRVHPEDLAPMMAALRSHLDGFSPTYDMRFRLLDGGGRYCNVLSRGRVVERNERGDAVRMVGTMTPLGEPRLAVPPLADAPAAARISHELRTPLHAIIGFSQLLSGSLGRSAKADQLRQLGLIEQAGWRLLAVVDDLLDRALKEGERRR